ncbi:MAG: spoIIIAH-like protein [Candidatus Paraimprobicoccus trichonymphae]|uniref:SpoIIIAH-like protein n=1 Tax=Candidatus Paraimprobicoccus trichonymphae TaxID=3033793 RepID=A0AA48KW87_9FIRM|nr:MAG: spoIIIAH-like protein [Candidatus Paraimprobicoccus trichonymphae]
MANQKQEIKIVKKKFSFRKRQVILASLVVSLGLAVYLNWQFSDDMDRSLKTTNILDSEKSAGEARFVNNSLEEESENPKNKNFEKKITSDIEYFSKAKAERQESREKSIKLLKDSLGDAQDSKSRAEIIRKISKISENLQKEINAENLIKAKIGAECLAIINETEKTRKSEKDHKFDLTECNVVVPGGALKDEKNNNIAIQIRDIVSNQIGIPFNNIKIIETKK